MHGPNLFIAGAPKCGTTALHEYLSQHPAIYMSELKEPHFYTIDMPRLSEFNEDDYLRLFRRAQPQHRYRGESSVYYLYSPLAIPRLMSDHPDARVVIMLRNPCELVYSLHAQHLVGLAEDIPSFLDAWHKQESRACGKAIPAHCPDWRLLQYRSIGMLGQQLARALQYVPRTQLQLVFFDDFKQDPGQAHAEVLKFLGLPMGGCRDFRRVNPNTRLRSPWLRGLLDQRRLPVAWRRWGRTLGLHRLHQTLLHWNQVPAERAPMSREIRSELIASFRDDVGLLSELTQRDLSSWLAV